MTKSFKWGVNWGMKNLALTVWDHRTMTMAHMEAFRAFWEPRADAIEMWKPHNFGDGRSYRERHQTVELKTTCGRPENGPLQIQWDGEVIPCCYDYNNQIVLGNAFEQPVLDILNGEKYRFLR